MHASREWVKPARGGTSERQRITYCTAPNEKVVIKGSERIISRARADGVWKAELHNSFFGNYNPYALTVSGGWLDYGQWHHRGDVYLDEEASLKLRLGPKLNAVAPGANQAELSRPRSGR